MLVVDASVGVKWFLTEALHDEARTLLLGEEALIAPDLFLSECANVLRLKAREGELDHEEVREILGILMAGIPELHPSDPLAPAALDLATSIEQPVYDCVYLALAVDRDAIFITADAEFHKKVEASKHRGRTRLLHQVVPHA